MTVLGTAFLRNRYYYDLFYEIIRLRYLYFLKKMRKCIQNHYWYNVNYISLFRK